MDASNLRPEILMEALRRSASALLFADEDLRIIEVNPAAERLLKSARVDLVGSSLERWLAVPSFRRLSDDWDRFLSSGRADTIGTGPTRGTFRGGDGVETEVEFDAAAVMNRDGWCLILACQERISEEAVEQALGAARRESRLRSVGEMAAGVAHNLNNHLGGLLGYVQLMRAAAPAGTERRAYLKDIERAALDAAGIVRRLQQFATGAAGDAGKATADLNETLTSILRLLRPRWLDEARLRDVSYEFSLNFEEVPRVRGHATVIAEVAQNLILNALRAMPRGGTISLRTWSPNPGVACFGVRDGGPGLPESLLPRLFKPFVRGSVEGHGLGLYTCRWLLDTVGGSIRAANARGGGAEFTVELRAGVSEAESRAEPASIEGLQGAFVLVVEDQPEILEIARIVLETNGARVRTAADGTQAMDYFARESFDVVLSDMGLPDMSGLKLLGFVRVRDPGAGTVLMSGFGMTQKEIADTPHRPDFIIDKPFELSALVMRVQEALAAGRKRRHRRRTDS